MLTLKELPTASASQVFHQAAFHMLNQFEKSLAGSTCAYRGDGNKMCAAGCFISDAEYNINLEDYTWRQLVEMGAVPKHHRDLIQRLQDVHDNSSLEAWANELYHLGKSHGISTDLYALMVKRGLSARIQEVHNGP